MIGWFKGDAETNQIKANSGSSGFRPTKYQDIIPVVDVLLPESGFVAIPLPFTFNNLPNPTVFVPPSLTQFRLTYNAFSGVAVFRSTITRH
jgi:hypothetical protein